MWERYLRLASVLEPLTLEQYLVIRTIRLKPLKLSGYCMYHVERVVDATA